MEIVAIYKCKKCENVYNGKCGPQDACKVCGSLYFEWINFKELNEKYFNKIYEKWHRG